MNGTTSASQAYRLNQVNSASPLELLIMAYDAALIGCGQRDLERTARALSELRKALDFGYDADIAMGFFRLYLYCEELARKGEYDEAAGILRELRAAWVQVKEQYQPQPAPSPQHFSQTQFQSVAAPSRVMVTS
ncbi:MAG: hypothetical protein KJ077_03065 [Anaerolineae bacterium]|nr:hypothetical protein [Anaerolineae bacterium]